MKKLLLILVLLGCSLLQIHAQSFKDGYWYSYTLGGFNYSHHQQISLGKSYHTGDSGKLGFHPAVQATGIYYFKSATFKDTKQSAETDQDHLKTDGGVMGRVNLRMDVSYQLSKTWNIGIGTDLAGFSFSGKQKHTFIPSERSIKDGPLRESKSTETSAGGLNVWSANGLGRGSWQSDVWVMQKREKVTLKYSVQYMQSQLHALDLVGLKGNDNFNFQTIALGIGLVWDTNN